jgi:hypothetical protein
MMRGILILNDDRFDRTNPAEYNVSFPPCLGSIPPLRATNGTVITSNGRSSWTLNNNILILPFPGCPEFIQVRVAIRNTTVCVLVIKSGTNNECDASMTHCSRLIVSKLRPERLMVFLIVQCSILLNDTDLLRTTTI